MRTVRRTCAIAFLTVAFSTFAFGEGWIGTGNKPPTNTISMTPSDEEPELIIAETDEESNYVDELYEMILLLLQMNLL